MTAREKPASGRDAVLPCSDAAHDEREYPDVYGIPGLRARHEQGRGILYRPGFPGRVAVPAAPGLWRKALLSPPA